MSTRQTTRRTKVAEKLRTDRRQARAKKGLSLEDTGITLQTRTRYFTAVRRIVHLLDVPRGQVDERISSWIKDEYEDGECIPYIGDVLSGLHHFAPWLKGYLPGSWRLFRLWRRTEKPRQAPPLPVGIAAAMVGRCLDLFDLDMAVLIALGFWGLLRTGELLNLVPAQILAGSRDVVIQLGLTKTGLRKQQDENVVIQHLPTVLLCQTFLDIRRHERSMHVPCIIGQGPEFRSKFQKLIEFFALTQPFRPYSLRRGGATEDFRRYNSMERTLIKGRWGTSLAARQYIQEGLSVLTTLQLKTSQIQTLKCFAKKFSPWRAVPAQIGDVERPAKMVFYQFAIRIWTKAIRLDSEVIWPNFIFRVPSFDRSQLGTKTFKALRKSRVQIEHMEFCETTWNEKLCVRADWFCLLLFSLKSGPPGPRPIFYQERPAKMVFYQFAIRIWTKAIRLDSEVIWPNFIFRVPSFDRSQLGTKTFKALRKSRLQIEHNIYIYIYKNGCMWMQ